MAKRYRDLFTITACIGFAIAAVRLWMSTGHAPGAFDIQMHFLPNMMYAARQLAEGGRGLLWNPYQNCGQPFFAISGTGLLYPVHWIFAFLDGGTALWTVTIINIAIGGVGMLALGRELGVSRAAALCGAVAYQLGNATLDVNFWSPMYGGPYAWVPWALYYCERILHTPSIRHGLALALVLTIALLPASPQIVVFTYQLIALRVMWEIMTRRMPRFGTTVAALALGLGLPPFLAAVYLVPSVEMAAASVRNRELSLMEMLEGGVTDWASLRKGFGERRLLFNPLTFVPALIAAAALPHRHRWRIAGFYLAAGLLFCVLACGPTTRLFDLYLHVPMTRTFRSPGRLIWITGFCLAVLTALGADALLQRDRMQRSVKGWLPLIALLSAAVAVYFFSPVGLLKLEWVLVVPLIVAAILAHAVRQRPLSAALMIGAVFINLIAFHDRAFPWASSSWSARGALYGRSAPLPAILTSRSAPLEWLRTRLTPQDRVAVVHLHKRYSLMPKSAQLFAFPSIHDYEPAPSQRSAEYAVLMRTGEPLRNLNSFYYLGGLMSPLPGPLMNLAAARYVAVDMQTPERPQIEAKFPAIGGAVGVGIYENAEALPRAYYVPRIEVVADRHAVLQRLNDPQHDPRQIALVEAMPQSRFTGSGLSAAEGSVQFVTDDPEHVVLRVEAPQRGFLRLSDQYFPGWHATVNGDAAPIERGDFLFRVVEVPQGTSLVEFRYAPASLRIGAAISAVAVVLLGFLWTKTRRAPA